MPSDEEVVIADRDEGDKRRTRVTGVVLAGGRSRRMGTDKRFVVVDGIPILERAVRAVAVVSDDVVIACQPGDRQVVDLATRWGVEMVFDRRASAGPLAGIEVALEVMAGDLALVVAADMPWLSVPVLRHLVAIAESASDVDVVAVESERGPQPLLATYRRSALVPVRDLLDADEHRVGALLDRLRVRGVPQAEWRALDPGGWTVRNVNEPGDLVDDTSR